MRDESLSNFINQHRLPETFRAVATEHYLPVAEWLVERHDNWHDNGQAMLLGINGAQGTGKSTFADFLALLLGEQHRRRVAVLSLDDFYLTHDERLQLAERVHPLLATRGVPGTHDVAMLQKCIDRLRSLRTGQSASLPRFDKSTVDRADPSGWPLIEGPVDLNILEGWCVASIPEHDDSLDDAINELEREQDADACWRRYVNERLASDYSDVFEQIDALIFMQAPSFSAVVRWRTENENHGVEAAMPTGLR